MTASTASVIAVATPETAGSGAVCDGVRSSPPRRRPCRTPGMLKTPFFHSSACISSRSRKGRDRYASAWHRRGSAQRAEGADLRLRRGVVPDAPSPASPVRGIAPCLDRPACPYFVASVGTECDTERPRAVSATARAGILQSANILLFYHRMPNSESPLVDDYGMSIELAYPPARAVIIG